MVGGRGGRVGAVGRRGQVRGGVHLFGEAMALGRDWVIGGFGMMGLGGGRNGVISRFWGHVGLGLFGRRRRGHVGLRLLEGRGFVGNDFSLVFDIGVISIFVSVIRHDLNTTIRKRYTIFSGSGVAVASLGMREIVARVAVLHCVAESVVGRSLGKGGKFKKKRKLISFIVEKRKTFLTAIMSVLHGEICYFRESRMQMLREKQYTRVRGDIL